LDFVSDYCHIKNSIPWFWLYNPRIYMVYNAPGITLRQISKFPHLVGKTHACISSDVEVRRKNSIIVTYLPFQCTCTNVTSFNFNSFVFLNFCFFSIISLILLVYSPVLKYIYYIMSYLRVYSYINFLCNLILCNI